MNRFDPIKHEYFIDDVLVPSVTQVLPRKNFFMSLEQLEFYKQEGREQHELIEMYFRFTYPGRYTGKNRMLMALDRWMEKDEYKLGKLVCCERPLFCTPLKFAGTPDVLFSNGIIDFKRSRVMKKDIALQIAGYSILAYSNNLIADFARMGEKQNWIMAWYDSLKDEFNSSEVYRADAEETFLLYLKRYYIDQMIERYNDK